MKTIFDPSFRYTTSFNTDLKKTFARIRRDQRAATERTVPAPAPSLGNVSSIARRTVDQALVKMITNNGRTH